MYIPPGFTVITCTPADEAALGSWAAENGGVWHPAKGNQSAYAEWDFGSYRNILAHLSALNGEDTAEWALLMYRPPQGVIDVELLDAPDEGDDSYLSVIRAMLQHWDGYVCDIGVHEWVSALLRDSLPAERIICPDPPPPGLPPAWIWVNGKYTKNEAYYDNLDVAAHENQL